MLGYERFPWGRAKRAWRLQDGRSHLTLVGVARGETAVAALAVRELLPRDVTVTTRWTQSKLSRGRPLTRFLVKAVEEDVVRPDIVTLGEVS